jgi:hypothetical protein
VATIARTVFLAVLFTANFWHPFGRNHPNRCHFLMYGIHSHAMNACIRLYILPSLAEFDVVVTLAKSRQVCLSPFRRRSDAMVHGTFATNFVRENYRNMCHLWRLDGTRTWIYGLM